MMNFGESVLFVGIIPGLSAGTISVIATNQFGLPWWGSLVAGMLGWVLGFLIVGIAGTIFEALSKRTSRKR